MDKILSVMLGGGTGAIARYLITIGLKRLNFQHWATFFVNMTGCFLMGYFVSRLGNSTGLFVVVGILGGFTTFSTFSYENIDLIAHEKYTEFLRYSLISAIGCMIGIALGYWV